MSDVQNLQLEPFHGGIIRAVGMAIEAAGLTRDEVADQIGIDQIEFMRYFAGHSHFYMEDLFEIARLTGTTLTSLIIEAEKQAALLSNT